MAIQSSFFRVPLVTPLALLPHLPLSHWYPARTHCPHSPNAFLPLMAFTHLSKLSCSFSSSGTYDLNNGKSRGKEKGDNRKRSSRKKRKTKKRERVPFADSQLYHTMLKLMGNGSLFSASDPFTSICTQFSQMERDVQRTGAVSKDKMWEGLIWHTWTQWEASLTSLLQKLAPFSSSTMAFAQLSQTSKLETWWKSHSSKCLGRAATRPPPTSLLLGQSSPGSTILNSQKLHEKTKKPAEIHQRRGAVSDLMAFLTLLPLRCLSLGPQTQHGWFSGQSHCKVWNFSFC